MTIPAETTTEQQTPAQQRLAAARAQLAEQQAGVGRQQDEAPAIKLPNPGDVVHCLKAGTTIHSGGQFMASGVVLNRGDAVVITLAMLDANVNRLGEPVGIALAADPAAQMAKWGELRFAMGDPPAELRPWVHGDADWSRARENARRQAWAMPTDAARADALAEVERAFGPAAATSVTTNAAPHRSIAEAAVQMDRLAERIAAGTR